MTKFKKWMKSFKEAIKKFLWSANNVLQRVKESVKSFFKKLWNKIIFKEQREEKKLAGYKEAQTLLKIDESLDIRYDVDLKAEYAKIDEELNSLREASKEASLNEKETINEKIQELKHLKKIMPPTREQLLRRELIIKESKGVGQAALYLWPALLLLAIFTFYPIVNALRLVFYDGYSDATGQALRGYTFLGNFKKVIKDANFIFPAAHTQSTALLNTVLVALIQVPVTVLVSLLISVALNSIKPLKGFFQTIFFLPYVTNSLAVGLVFAFIFKADGGLFNKFLGFFNVEGGAWVSQGATYWKAIFVLVMFQIWNGLAFKIMLFISAIQGIDEQYYQAASIDATPKFKQFTRITAPLISPTIFYVVITSFIGALKSYSSVIAIFGNEGAPAGATFTMKTIVFYIYDFFDSTGNMPEAAAASIILFGIILLMTFVQMQVGKRRVHY